MPDRTELVTQALVLARLLRSWYGREHTRGGVCNQAFSSLPIGFVMSEIEAVYDAMVW